MSPRLTPLFIPPRVALFLGACMSVAGIFGLIRLAIPSFEKESSFQSTTERVPWQSETEAPSEHLPIRFVDRANSAGIAFTHIDGHTPMHYFPEVMGGGSAWLDYDQDGFMDLLFVQGGPFPLDNAWLQQIPTSRLF